MLCVWRMRAGSSTAGTSASSSAGSRSGDDDPADPLSWRWFRSCVEPDSVAASSAMAGMVGAWPLVVARPKMLGLPREMGTRCTGAREKVGEYCELAMVKLERGRLPPAGPLGVFWPFLVLRGRMSDVKSAAEAALVGGIVPPDCGGERNASGPPLDGRPGVVVNRGRVCSWVDWEIVSGGGRLRACRERDCDRLAAEADAGRDGGAEFPREAGRERW